MDCQNYIKTLQTLHDGRMLVCGTSAYNPTCDYMVSITWTGHLLFHTTYHVTVDRCHILVVYTELTADICSTPTLCLSVRRPNHLSVVIDHSLNVHLHIATKHALCSPTCLLKWKVDPRREEGRGTRGSYLWLYPDINLGHGWWVLTAAFKYLQYLHTRTDC